MSKISEQKALEAYPLPKEEYYSTSFINQETFNSSKRTGYIQGYDQAMKDVIKHAEELHFRSDGFGYAYGCGYEKAMQDFLEKACKWWSTIPDDTYGFNPCKVYVEQFKNYIQDESEK